MTWVTGFLSGVQKLIHSTSTWCIQNTFSLNKQLIEFFFSVLVTGWDWLLHSPVNNSHTSPSTLADCSTLPHLPVYFLPTQTSLKGPAQITGGPDFPWSFFISSLHDAYSIPWEHCCELSVYFWILQLCKPWNISIDLFERNCLKGKSLKESWWPLGSTLHNKGMWECGQ